MKITKFVAAAAVSLLSIVSAHAAVVSALSPLYSFSWSYSGGAAGLLTGTGSMSFSGFGTENLSTTITLNNTSTVASNRLTAFGFGIDPNVKSVTFSDGTDGGIIGAVKSTQQGSTQIPSLTGIEVCAFGGNNCAGGANGGILGGASDTFTLVLKSYSRWSPNVTIDPIGFKYQTGKGSYEFTTVTAVPEPQTYAMMLAGLGLIGTIARRRKNKAA